MSVPTLLLAVPVMVTVHGMGPGATSLGVNSTGDGRVAFASSSFSFVYRFVEV